MAKKRYSDLAGLRIFCVALAFIIVLAGCTIGGLELWGKGEMKPSNWGKKDAAELAAVTITLQNDDPVATQINGARRYALAQIASVPAAQYPSTKTATASCTLPEGGKPDRYEWKLSGVPSSYVTVESTNADGSIAAVTATRAYETPAKLEARAYLGDDLRGYGSINVYLNKSLSEEYLILDVFYLSDGSEDYNAIVDAFRAYDATEQGYWLDLHEYSSIEDCAATTQNYCILIDENGRIAENDFTDLLDAGVRPFLFDVGTASSAQDEATHYELARASLPWDEIENALTEWASDEELHIAHKIDIQDAKFISLMDRNSIGDRYEVDDWQALIDSGQIEQINCIALSSSKELSAATEAFIASGNDVTAFKWIILDVRDADAEEVRQLVAQGAELYAYKQTLVFENLLAAVQQIEESGDPGNVIDFTKREALV